LLGPRLIWLSSARGRRPWCNNDNPMLSTAVADIVSDSWQKEFLPQIPYRVRGDPQLRHNGISFWKNTITEEC
jgi:hypothetical protein